MKQKKIIQKKKVFRTTKVSEKFDKFKNTLLTTEQNKKNLLIGLGKFNCFVSKACSFAGVSHRTFQKYFQEDETFRDSVDELTEAKIDFMEERLEDKVLIDTTANIFWLKCKGRKRGWNERMIIESAPAELKVEDGFVDSVLSEMYAKDSARLKAEEIN